jgi:hypothetical protein
MGLTFCKSLKKHVEKMSVFRLSIMLMKTNELNRHLHYVDEKKGEINLCGSKTWGMRRAAARPLQPYPAYSRAVNYGEAAR